MRVTLYSEYYRLWGGFFFKKEGMGYITSYKNQMKALTRAGVTWTEDLSLPCDIFQANAQGLRTLYLLKSFKRRGTKTIIYAHATAEELFGGFRIFSIFSSLYRLYLSYIYNSADVVICPSEYTAGLLQRNYAVPQEKTIFISNGVDADFFVFNPEKREQFRANHKISHDEIVVMNCAMVLAKKGIDTFISLGRHFPAAHFIWYGKIFKSGFAEEIPAHSENTLFYGYVPDIAAAYSAGDIFLFPSYEENQGISVLEAGARGLPIVVRDIPVYSGWLRDGENCLKAKTLDEFNEKLSLLISDSALRQRLGEKAHETILLDHTLSAVGEKLKSLYTRLAVG